MHKVTFEKSEEQWNKVILHFPQFLYDNRNSTNILSACTE